MTTTEQWVLVSKQEDIPLLGARVVKGAVAGPIALFKASDETIFAVLDRCPHKGGPLSQGIVHGHAVTCPIHSWNIDLNSGCALAPDEGCARRFEVKCLAGEVFLRRDQLAAV
ncbi:MAG: nitrite reductase small subunit NirD [Alcaligenaceae bacterium]|jgi:nitrite reductase (NADH) small subunit